MSFMLSVANKSFVMIVILQNVVKVSWGKNKDWETDQLFTKKTSHSSRQRKGPGIKDHKAITAHI